jgi:hypothetical protein
MLWGNMADLNTFRENLRSLVAKLEQDKNHYLQKGYPEAQVRIDFLNPLFETFRATHLKDTVKGKKPSIDEKQNVSRRAFSLSSSSLIAAVSFSFGVSLHCTSHPSGLRSRW